MNFRTTLSPFQTPERPTHKLKRSLFGSKIQANKTSFGVTFAIKGVVAFSSALLVLTSLPASAAEIFVRQATGAEASTPSSTDITDMVRSAVESMPEHQLVDNEVNADYVLLPRVISRSNGPVLRIERYRENTLISSSEEPLRSVESDQDGAFSVVMNSLKVDTNSPDLERRQARREPGPQTTEPRYDAPASDSLPSTQHEMDSSRQSNRRRHTMNPYVGRTSDIPASDTSSANASAEVRTDEFQRRSVFGGPGYFIAEVGLGFASGLDTENTMFNLDVGYAIDFTRSITGKAVADMTMGTGSDVARFMDFALGANFYPMAIQSDRSKPYIGGDLGYALVRNNNNASRDTAAVGATAGFQFIADQTNVDVALHYKILTSKLAGDTPQTLGLKLGMNF